MTYISNWSTVMNNQRVRQSATFVFTTFGVNYYIYEGKRIGQKKFESLYPVDLKRVNIKGQNPDRTRIE